MFKFLRRRRVATVAEPLARIRKEARPVGELPTDDYHALAAQIGNLERERNALLNMEVVAQRVISARIEALQEEQKIRLCNQRLKRYLKESGRKVGVIDFSVFSWPNADGLPVLTLFDPNYHQTDVRIGTDVTVLHCYCCRNDNLRDRVGREYLKIVDSIQSFVRSKYGRGFVSLKAQFPGVVPNEVKTLAAAANRHFLWTGYLAEAKWEVEPIPADPLLVAWDGYRLLLLDAFDVTSAEDYVRREFTTDA